MAGLPMMIPALASRLVEAASRLATEEESRDVPHAIHTLCRKYELKVLAANDRNVSRRCK